MHSRWGAPVPGGQLVRPGLMEMHQCLLALYRLLRSANCRRTRASALRRCLPGPA